MLASTSRRGEPRRGSRVECSVIVVGLLLLTACLPPTVAAQPPPPQLSIEGDGSAGHLRASWSSSISGAQSELQVAEDASFGDAQVRYRGFHTASVFSGLRDGTLYFRVRTLQDGQVSDWSNVEPFTVQHHERGFALLLVAAGALVFAATLGFLLYFAKQVRRD